MVRKKLFWLILLVLLIAVGISLLGDTHGHVIIVRAPYRVQLSFNFLLFLMASGFLMAHYYLRLMGYFNKIPARWRAKKAIKQLKSRQALLLKIVASLAQQNYLAAEQLAKQVKYTEQEDGKAEFNAVMTLIRHKNTQPTPAIEDHPQSKTAGS